MRGDFLPEAHNKTRRVVEGQTWATYVGVGHFDVLANDTSQAGKKKRKERRMLKAVVVQDVTGHPPRTLEEFVQDYKARFVSASAA
jgi:hypothetical protein